MGWIQEELGKEQGMNNIKIYVLLRDFIKDILRAELVLLSHPTPPRETLKSKWEQTPNPSTHALSDLSQAT